MPDTPKTVHAPWTADQVTALNTFQHYGRMHPFTCGALHASGQSPILIATNSGWVCPDPQCTFRQDWAHAFMVERGAAAVPVPSPADQTALRAAVAEALATADGWQWAPGYDKTQSPAFQEYLRHAEAVLAVLPEQTDRAALLRQEADQIRAHCPDHLDSDSAPGAWMVCHCDVADDMMRRLAGAPQPETEAVPRRGDAVEQWLKAQRDAAVDYPEAYQGADGLLDLYRLHADTGTPLGEHVCEGRVVGDCECLEQPQTPEADRA